MARRCAYCGRAEVKLTTDHIIPKCLYPPSRRKRTPSLQLLTAPACDECNKGFTNDEAYFLHMLVLAGKSNAAVQELWATTMDRGLREQKDGWRRVEDVHEQMIPIATPDGERRAVFPGNDERVMRVVKKVIRGLSYHHELPWPVQEEQVCADVLKCVLPQELLDIMQPEYHVEEDVFRCRYGIPNCPGFHSVWVLTFFDRTIFLGAVTASAGAR